MNNLRDAIDYVEANHPLPRCEHGQALRDHSGEALEPPCGCRAVNSEPTVEEAIDELRNMFPDKWVQIEVSSRPVMGTYYMVRIYGVQRQGEWLPSLKDCMTRVRKWKESQ